MAEKRPFRFAAMTNNAESGSEFLERVRQVEAMGYTQLAMVDHFNLSYAPVPSLTAAALTAPSLRVLATVFDNDYRNPVLLAKEMATLDQLSGGRVDVGIGAGWTKSDYDQSGVRYDPPGVRISRMVEGLEIMKGFWSGEPFNFSGEHYEIEDLRGYPAPVQKPHPPVYIGGGGKRMLSIAAREADIIGVHVRFGPEAALTAEDATREAMVEKMGWIRDAAGDRYDNIEFALLLFTAKVTSSSSETEAEASAIAGRLGISVEAVMASPYYHVGSEDEMAENLEDLRETFGVNHFAISGASVDSFAPVAKRLAGR